MTTRSQTQKSQRSSMTAAWRPVVAAVLLAAAGAAGAAKVVSGPTPYRVSDNCAICHGMHGASTDYNVIPRLAGQHKAYLVMQLKQFRDGHRADQNGNIYMAPVAQGLTNGEIDQVASYFAKQRPRFQASGVHHAGAKAGKAIFMNGVTSEQIPACMECHGANAQGASTFPDIAGQRYRYIVQQLKYFHNGARKNVLMNQIAKSITVPQMKEVAAYLSSL
ncbi:c-type cytochrome [Acidiferrobacter sp.]|uniref:c-type cytochrome n=1 Tax=Acidiferrobacter sp. TaxID=1872107 RepID=UPI002613ACEB|nr:c-type cytochrome [Acidiferrobacter sp.]